MAFSFLGTFTTGQLEQLRKFAKVQEVELASRRKFLVRKMYEIGAFVTLFDAATKLPLRYSVSYGSYAGKLLQAYKALGGHPEKEFILRTRDQPVYLTLGSPIDTQNPQNAQSGFSDQYSNGRRNRGDQRFDRDVAVLVEKFKEWQLEPIKRKRENLEYKLKRALDYFDELQLEYDMLGSMLELNSGQSVDAQIVSITRTMTRVGATNVVEDSEDLFGYNIGRPGDPNVVQDLDQAEGEDLRI